MSALISKIRTVDEKEKLSQEVGLLLDSLYKEKGNGFYTSLKSQVRLWVSEIINSEAQQGGADIDKIEAYLKDIQKRLDALEVVTLTLSFEPTDATIDKFTKVIRGGRENTILDFSYDPAVLGGAIVSFKGEYRDFSLKRLYESEYKTKEEEVLKIMYSR